MSVVTAVLLALGLAATPRPSTDLIQTLDLRGLERVIEAAGVTIQTPVENGFAVVGPGDARLLVTLDQCQGGGACAYLRTRASYDISTSSAARDAIHSYENSVPIAWLSVSQKSGKVVVSVGRDVWLATGRTFANIANEVEMSAILATSLRDHLLTADPALANAWKAPSDAP